MNEKLRSISNHIAYKTPASFGSPLIGRTYQAESIDRYRFAFNGKEKDDETYGSWNCIAFEARIYDSRLGRFLSTDPRESDYGWQSTYSYFRNAPISQIDTKGMGGPYEDNNPSENSDDNKTNSDNDLTKKKPSSDKNAIGPPGKCSLFMRIIKGYWGPDGKLNCQCGRSQAPKPKSKHHKNQNISIFDKIGKLFRSIQLVTTSEGEQERTKKVRFKPVNNGKSDETFTYSVEPEMEITWYFESYDEPDALTVTDMSDGEIIDETGPISTNGDRHIEYSTNTGDKPNSYKFQIKASKEKTIFDLVVKIDTPQVRTVKTTKFLGIPIWRKSTKWVTGYKKEEKDTDE